MARIRGLELLFNLLNDKLKSKEDCLVAAVHCLLINEGLQCVGVGEEFSDQDQHAKTELLPNHWNDNQDVYTLKYLSKDYLNRYLVKIVKAGRILHINVVVNEVTTASLSVDVNEHVKDERADYNNTYDNLDGLKISFNSGIWEKLHEKPPEPKPSSKVHVETRPIGGLGQPHPGPRPGGAERFIVPPAFTPRFPSVGGQDLNPFGMGYGGGMLMDPSSIMGSRPRLPYGLPRGAVPPGARFDPFGPDVPGPNRGFPDPDHLRRRDFEDDFL